MLAITVVCEAIYIYLNAIVWCPRNPRPEGRPIRGLRRLPAAPPAGDLATRVRDCPFQAECHTYRDALVPAALKGPAGRGCVDQTDEHRKQHCKAFARKLLARILREVMTSSEPL